MGKRRTATDWPPPDLAARREAVAARWRDRFALGIPLTRAEDHRMRRDWQADPPPKGHDWPPKWWERYYRLRLTGTDAPQPP